MKNIPQILLKTYLRRRPVHLRLKRFNYLTRYSWLKNLLEDLKPELFPPEAPPAVEPVEETDEEAAAIAAQLIEAEVRGRQGLYRVERWLGTRGQGYLFAATRLGAKQPVVLKEYLLPTRIFNELEARQRQFQFEQFAGLSHPSGQGQDLRIVRPLDAIADTQSVERCYLITDERDAALTLRQHLQAVGPLSAPLIRQVLEQILQTLLHLHQQIMVLPSGQRQLGLVHGNLSLDSLLWVEYTPGQWFIYLTDFALWERLFDPPTTERFTVMVTEETVNRDLVELGQIAYSLLTGQTALPPETSPMDLEFPPGDPYLAQFVQQLLTPFTFESAEQAWQSLLRLPTLTAAAPPPKTVEAETDQQRRLPRWLLLLLGTSALLLVLGVIGQLWSRREVPASVAPQACCLDEVGAVPAGEYTYTGIVQGTWSYVLAQENLGPQGAPLESLLQSAQPQFILNYQPTDRGETAIAAILAGEADFAILAQTADWELPSEIGATTIAFDGLAVIVPFSYAERQQGLPQSLNGRLALDDLTDIYLGQIETWRELSRTRLPIKRYAPANLEALQIFEQKVLQPVSLDRLSNVTVEPTLAMLRSILQDFETRQLGSIGFAPMSQVYGQCSVYPLALREESRRYVQPLVFTPATAITPATNLCDRKGAYFPEPEVFQTGTYPLAYEIVVVYPQDNSRVPVGQKFAELMQTVEGQQLIREAGLVPVAGATP